MTTSGPNEQGESSAREGRGHVPGADLLLHVWERGQKASPGERGLMLLRVAAPSLREVDRAELSVGRRDAHLLDLIGCMFGDTAAALCACPACAEQLEFDVPLNEISATAPADAPDRYVLIHERYEIAYRLPCAGDLAALGAELRNATVGAAARSLAQRCVLAIRDSSGGSANVGLTDEASAALEAAIAVRVLEDDPQAVVTLTFDCPSCAAHWQAPFDIVEFLWSRLDDFARGLLRDVHVLASIYGWSEREIVSLSPWRRRQYFKLIEA
jgi:hypothetical protein